MEVFSKQICTENLLLKYQVIYVACKHLEIPVYWKKKKAIGSIKKIIKWVFFYLLDWINGNNLFKRDVVVMIESTISLTWYVDEIQCFLTPPPLPEKKYKYEFGHSLLHPSPLRQLESEWKQCNIFKILVSYEKNLTEYI